MKNLRDLLTHEVQDMYSAQTQLVEALPRMSKAAKDEKLKSILDRQLQETRQQKERLEQVAKLMHVKPEGEMCRGMEGLIREEENLLKDISDPQVIDAALIGATQRIEHYKIAGYGTARTYAQMLGENDISNILGKSLKEDKDADKKLTDIAVERVNEGALA